MYDEKIIDAIRDHMVKKQQTIAVAESVTSGHLQVALGSALNASKFFQGGMVKRRSTFVLSLFMLSAVIVCLP